MMGKTKLDHILSYIDNAFEKFLEYFLIVAIPLLIVEQICIYAGLQGKWMWWLLVGVLFFIIALVILNMTKGEE